MDRENEGDFIMAADLATPEAIATIVRYSSGVICVGMEGKAMDRLELPAMLVNNEDPKGTAFSVTVDGAPEHGITTGISAAGTDSSIHLNIIGDKGSTGDLHLNGDRNNGSNWNKFERENTDIFHIYSVDLGSIEGATISSSGKCFYSNWYLSSISIENSYFSVNRWIKKGSYTFKENRLSKDYHIQVKTGDENGAGTDSDIYLTIHGEEGSTPEIRLNGYILGDAFERNDLDSLTLFGLPDVGTIKSVKLRSNGRWAASNWYLHWISINNDQVVVNQWIDGKTKNGPIELWNLEILAVVKNSGNETSNPETVKKLQS